MTPSFIGLVHAFVVLRGTERRRCVLRAFCAMIG
jgi:hypothetical protein